MYRFLQEYRRRFCQPGADGSGFFIFLVPGRFCRGDALTLGAHAAGAVHGIELRLHNHFMCDGGTHEKDGGVVWRPAGGDNGIWVQSY